MAALKPETRLVWRLHTVMSERNIYSAAELHRRLLPYGVNITRPQLSRIVKKLPSRLNTQVLHALLVELQCSADELLSVQQPSRAVTSAAPLQRAAKTVAPATAPAPPAAGPAPTAAPSVPAATVVALPVSPRASAAKKSRSSTPAKPPAKSAARDQAQSRSEVSPQVLGPSLMALTRPPGKKS